MEIGRSATGCPRRGLVDVDRVVYITLVIGQMVRPGVERRTLTERAAGPAQRIVSKEGSPKKEEIMETATREPQIQSEMHRLEKSICELCELYPALDERLRSVTTNNPPSGDAMTQPTPVVPLAERLRKFRTDVEGANMALKSLLDRLEV